MMVYLCAALIILGVVCMVAETFISGFGVFGLVGIASLIASSVLAVLYVPFGWLIVAAEIAALGGFFYLLFGYMKRKQLYKNLIMGESLNEDVPELQSLDGFIGKEGMAVTALRPAGEVEIGGIRLEAVSEGPFISRDTLVKAVGVQKDKLIIREEGQYARN